jgi:hypothetical protein
MARQLHLGGNFVDREHPMNPDTPSVVCILRKGHDPILEFLLLFPIRKRSPPSKAFSSST